jgi:hypothetical protein
MGLDNVDKNLEVELAHEYDEYIEGLSGRKEKGFCDDCIELGKRKGKGKFWPRCNRSTDEFADLIVQGVEDPMEAQILRESVDPVEWAKNELDWHARWYQAQAFRCTSFRQTCRWGRRTGKTHYLAMRALYMAALKPGVREEEPYAVLIVTPYEDQLIKIFEYVRLALQGARSLRVHKDKQSPQMISFNNGAKIIGFTAGEKAGSRSGNIRGQDANAIIIDEADMIRGDDVDAVLAILASHEDCYLYFSSTPTGLPTKFRTACEDPELGFKQFWFASHESPAYSEETDRFFKKMFARIEFEHEILATFGLPDGGVFMPDDLSAAIHEYPLGQQLAADEYAVIGVDCNDKNNGTHAVVMAAKKGSMQMRLVDKAILRGAHFTVPKSRQMLIELFTKWNATLLALDKGFSHSHIEGLIEYGLHHPNTGLGEALKYYDLGAQWSFIDPMTGTERKRPYKPLMVGISQLVLQEGNLTLPKTEDFEGGIVGQMKKFHIKRWSQNNQPIYSQGNEHTLTAMMIAIMSWQLEIVGFEPTTADTTLAIAIPPEAREEAHVLPVGLQEPKAGYIPKRPAMPVVAKYPTRVPLYAPWPGTSRGIGPRNPNSIRQPPRRTW